MKKIVFLFLAVGTLACGPNEEQVKREKKNQEVWDAHDAVMPKMDDIMMAQKALNKGISSMKEDSASMDSAWFAHAMATNTKLMKAHDDMMAWMRGYEYPGDSISFQEAMDYMETERIIITEVGIQTDNALTTADSLQEAFTSKKSVTENE